MQLNKDEALTVGALMDEVFHKSIYVNPDSGDRTISLSYELVKDLVRMWDKWCREGQ